MQEYEFSDQLMCNCMFFGIDIMIGISITLIIAGLVIGLFKTLKERNK